MRTVGDCPVGAPKTTGSLSLKREKELLSRQRRVLMIRGRDSHLADQQQTHNGNMSQPVGLAYYATVRFPEMGQIKLVPVAGESPI